MAKAGKVVSFFGSCLSGFFTVLATIAFLPGVFGAWDFHTNLFKPGGFMI